MYAFRSVTEITMFTVVMVGSILFTSVTSSDELYACQYPGCTCEELVTSPQEFSLTCHVTEDPGVGLPPRNVSVNIVTVTLLCDEVQGDPAVLVDNIHQDLLHVRALTLRGCVTSLLSLFGSDRFSKLTKLSLDNVTLSDHDLSDVISQRPLVSSLEITKSERVNLQTICRLTQLSQLTLSRNNILNLSHPVCNTGQVFSNLTKLDVSHNNLTSFPTWISRAPFLSELYLQYNRLTDIPADVFQETAHLTVLDLSSNQLTSLTENLLSKQSDLVNLNLSSNQLSKIPTAFLGHTENLTRLDLSFNRLKYLYSGVFSNLHKLNILNLSSNEIIFLLRTHLANMKNLLYLDLGNNSFSNIPDLTACKSLTVLDMRRNRIKHILGSSIRGLSNLEGISLKHNRLTSIRLEHITVSSKLSVLDFSHNNISYIDYTSEMNVSVDLSVTDSLSVLSSVRVLLLNSNQLSNIYRLSRVFTGLETLLLDDNKISSLSRLDLPPSIQNVGLSYNRITSIERYMFQHFPHLKIVGLQANYPYLTTLPVTVVSIDSNADPKPEMYIAGNLFFCDCNMAYLKIYHERDKHESFRYFNKHLPKFADLNDVLCITEKVSTMRKLVNVPEEDFMCRHEDQICETLCNCCDDQEGQTCPCLHTCPANCTCTELGSYWGSHSYRIYCDNPYISAIPKIPPLATYLHLDNTSIEVLTEDTFANLGYLQKLFLNHSKVSSLIPGCFNGLGELTHLYLNDNRLRSLASGMWTGLGQLTHLYLHNNLIHSIEPESFVHLHQLQYLDLSNNHLSRVSTDNFPVVNSSTVIVITDNPLSCSCPDIRQTILFLTVYGPNVAMLDSLVCVIPFNDSEINQAAASRVPVTEEHMQRNLSLYKTMLIKEFDLDECNRSTSIINETRYANQKYLEDNRYAVTLSVLSVLLVMAIVLAVVTYRKRSEIQAWLFVKFGVRVRSKNTSLDETGRTYDAFVSYSSHDEHLVVHELAPRLEEGIGERRGKRHYHLCLHYRDFPVGDCIADTIIESIEASKRTIMLLSDNFLSSEWCRYEFQTAHHHVLKERSHRLIIVLLHELDDRKLDPDLRVHLNEGNYLRYNDPWFWEKLYFALPDVPVSRHGGQQNGVSDEKRQQAVNNEWDNASFKNDELDIRFDDTEWRV